jgi:hypothetical protein
MDPEKINAIMNSSLPEAEKSRLINELMGIKTKAKKQYTPQQIEMAKDRLKLAREAKAAKKEANPYTGYKTKEEKVIEKETKQQIDVKAIEDIFEKKYNSEMAKMSDALLDLNKNISEMAKMKKQKEEKKKMEAEQKKLEAEQKKVEQEKPKEQPQEPKKVIPQGKIAFPNYRNIFTKK